MRSYDRSFLGEGADEFWAEQAANLKAVSPKYGAGSFSTPILLIHGLEDKRVPVRQSRLLAEELRKAGKPFEYIEQPKGDHHLTRQDDRIQFLRAMKAFLDKHNPA